MTRAPAALALLALLSPTAMAEPCSPRVDLSGDRDAVARVAVELTQLGILLGASDAAERACAVTAVVADEGEHLTVAVRDNTQRSEGRVVSDPKVAAAWIDSWVRDEISWTSPPPAPLTTVSVIPPPPIEPSPLDRFGFSVAAERSWTDDNSEWNGFDIAGCMHLGIACIGGRVRAGFQSNLAVNATAADRSDIVALATASLPLSFGQVTVAPELGLGVGRTRTRRVESCSPSSPPSMTDPNTPDDPTMCDPMDPMCVMPSPPPGDTCVGDNYDRSTYLPRVAVAVRFAFPIVRHVWLDAVAGYTQSPITRQVDPDDMVAADPTIAMPLEPTHGYHLGIGIRVGTP